MRKTTWSTYSRQLLTQILIVQGWNRMCHRETRGASLKVASVTLANTWPASILFHFLGLARCCFLYISHVQGQSDFFPAWVHRCSLGMQSGIGGGGEGRHDTICTFDVIIRNFKASVIQGGTIPRLVLGDLKAIWRHLPRIHRTWLEQHMEKMF